MCLFSRQFPQFLSLWLSHWVMVGVLRAMLYHVRTVKATLSLATGGTEYPAGLSLI